MNDLFVFVKRVGGRKIYFRPVIVNNQAHLITEETIALIAKLSDQHQVLYHINTNKTLPRNYKKCHQMFQFPVFCANGKIYTCCEGKGNPQFELANWDQDDFRDAWLSARHYEIYNTTRVEFCQPCRPNINNIQIQQALDNPMTMETLFV
jgi:sulfatase maturation enzyme AslB (radical SAM superfamily)